MSELPKRNETSAPVPRDLIGAPLQVNDLDGRDSHTRIRSAGCASGQEAYSLAMVFADTIGPDQFRQRSRSTPRR